MSVNLVIWNTVHTLICTFVLSISGCWNVVFTFKINSYSWINQFRQWESFSFFFFFFRWGFLSWELIFIYCELFVLILVVFFVVSSRYLSAKFHLWPSSGYLPRPRIGMLSLVTVSPVITAFHSYCLSHHVFDQVNLWPAGVIQSVLIS